MELNDNLSIRLSHDLKKELEDKGITSEHIRQVLEDQIKKNPTYLELLSKEEEKYREWVYAFEERYRTLQERLKNKDNMILAEVKKTESEWEKLQRELKSTNEKCDEIPEITELTYQDVFDITKIKEIVDRYWDSPAFRIGVVQIMRYVCYREVQRGNFKTLQASMDQFKKDKEAKLKQYDDNINTWLNSDEFKKESMLRQRLIKKEKTEEVMV